MGHSKVAALPKAQPGTGDNSQKLNHVEQVKSWVSVLLTQKGHVKDLNASGLWEWQSLP